MKLLQLIKTAKMVALICLFSTFLVACVHTPSLNSNSKSERVLIEAVLMDYIDGTSTENPDQLRRAFHPDFNLYAANNDNSLRVWRGADYIANFKLGNVNSRKGKIISVDFENDIAVAKAEITIPDSRIFTDYFLLVKYEGQWKIIHKSYTSRNIDTN